MKKHGRRRGQSAAFNRARVRIRATIAPALAVFLSGCGPIEVEDPVQALSKPVQSPHLYDAAMLQIRNESSTLSDAETQVLRGVIHRPGYTPKTREQAFLLLEERDPEALRETIEFNLPRLEAVVWRRRLCELIATRGWVEMTPTLVRALAYPWPQYPETRDRPEYKALVSLHGDGEVVDTVYQLFLEGNTVALQGLRNASWTVLIDLGARERLVELLRSSAIPEDDLMLQDLKASARDLGIIPENREEILWIRSLRQPQWSQFWKQASEALSTIAPERRAELELRDLSIIVASSMHEPSLIERTKEDLLAEVKSRIERQQQHVVDRYSGYLGTNKQYLPDHREKLTWGDLAAMLIALRAMDVPQVRDHLFDYADRDVQDTSTEYGGVIGLDQQHRFEILEFVPRTRQNDSTFHASQAMFDASYGAVFHFHLHAMRYENARYAGPGFGDLQYAETTRANCLVFTFIDENTLNVDYYRHDRVVVDLGEIHRP